MYTDDEKDYFMRYSAAQTHEEVWKFKKGDTLIVVGSRDLPYEQFTHVTALEPTSEGIFETRPYIKVTDGVKTVCAHAHRFIPVVGRTEKPL